MFGQASATQLPDPSGDRPAGTLDWVPAMFRQASGGWGASMRYSPVSGAMSFDSSSGVNGNSRHEFVTKSFSGSPPTDATIEGGMATSTAPGVTVLAIGTSLVLPCAVHRKSLVLETAQACPRYDPASAWEVAPSASSSNMGWTSAAG